MHFCIEQRNMSRFACCQFVLLINDSNRFPFCTEDILANATATQFLSNASLANSEASLSTPVYLSLPAEVPADHVTFMFGIIILMSIAVCCTFLMSKMAKPRLAHISVGGINYDLLMWLSSNHERRSSLLLFLRELACRRNRTRATSLSVISSASLNALPSYRSATTTTSPTSIPPPPYEELQQLTLDEPSLRETDIDRNNN
ncbi:hypothetical protein QR680_003362 [Steinernema hermaphroditum]|uniref:Uncharacterized protein n=1 Tax=Steinernema hermaphroditum TaxID=289476 RepID=A0AA39H6L9_9BILA|nr:hypothetical protein QR680_003362 [Steinernema hermaphroditum]